MKKYQANKKSKYSRLFIQCCLILSVTAIIFYCISVYLIHLFWLSIQERLSTEHKNQIQISKAHIVEFKDVAYEVNTTHIGIKISGLKHRDGDFEITYNNPIYFRFNPWNLSIASYYSGDGAITSKKKKYEFFADVKYEIITKLDFVIMKKILKNPFNIIRYFNSIDLVFNKVSISQAEKKIININNTKYSIIPRNIPIYQSFDNIENNLPSSFILEAKLDVKHSNAKTKFPSTFFYPISYQESIQGLAKLDVDSDAPKLSMADILSKANIDLVVHNMRLNLANFDGHIKLLQHKNDTNSHLEVSFTPSVGFSDKMIALILNHRNIKNFTNALKDSDIMTTIKEHIPPFDEGAKYRIKWHISYPTFGVSNYDIRLNEFSAFTQRNVGVGLKGSLLLKDFDFKLNADILLFRAQDMIAYWNRHYYSNSNENISDPQLLNAVQDFRDKLMLNVLRGVSEYPNSTSKDIALKIQARGNYLNISGNDWSSVTQRFMNIKMNMVNDALLKQNNKTEFLLKVAPEFESLMNEVLKINPGSKKNKLGSKLWQKLMN